MTADKQPAPSSDAPSSIARPRRQGRRAANRHEVAVIQAEVRQLARALRPRPRPPIGGDSLERCGGDQVTPTEN